MSQSRAGAVPDRVTVRGMHMQLYLLIIMALALPMSYASAEEIQLRCDPLRGSKDPIMLLIDTEGRGVMFEQGNKYYPWINSRYQKRNDDDAGSVGCTFDEFDYVEIEADIIRFGTTSKNANYCGIRGAQSAPGQLHDYSNESNYSINRNTGILTVDSRDKYQCSISAGAAIPLRPRQGR